MSTIVSLAMDSILFQHPPSSCPRKRASSIHGFGNEARSCLARNAVVTGSPACAGDDSRVCCCAMRSKLHAVGAFEAEDRARLLRGRDLVAELLDQAPHLGDLLGVAL